MQVADAVHPVSTLNLGFCIEVFIEIINQIYAWLSQSFLARPAKHWIRACC
jgi:hypothetical protein